MSSDNDTDPAADDNGKLVFVYGTLKTGQPNHARLREYLQADISVLGNAVTKYPYPLVLATEYNVPFLINEICYTAKRVSGELLRVTDRALAFLDYVESAPNLYCRERIEVEFEPAASAATAPSDLTGNSSETDATSQASSANIESLARWCWCYFLAHHSPRLVTPPFYSEYDSAQTPLRLDVDSLTPQQEEAIKRCIAREAQILP